MKKDQFLILIDKYINNSATEEERILVENYYNALDNFDRSNLKIENEALLKEAIFDKINAKIHTEKDSKHVAKKLNLWWISVAAVLVVIFSVSIFFISKNKKQTDQVDYASLIKPGGNNAVLTLSSGQKVILNDHQVNKSIKQEGNVTVVNINTGILNYTETKGESNSNIQIFNTIETPRGGKYKVVLNDGTIAWLNAGSSLKFPVEFKGKQRKVELTGEGYFEVAHNSEMPFIVSTKTQNVEVLGTHFNINAYEDEPSIKTTLLQGKVKVSSKVNNKFGYLNPGNQSNFSGSDFEIRDVDLQLAVDWKDDKFLFRDEDIHSIMRKLSRWYDIDVNYEKPLEGVTFSGKISRSKNLNDILKIFTSTYDVKFIVKERRVTVSQ